MPAKRMSHEARRKRRLELVNDLRKGMSDEEAARKYRMGASYVTILRRMIGGLPMQNQNSLSVSTFAILKHIVDGMSQADVARKFGVTRQRVSRIAVQARKAGWNV